MAKLSQINRNKKREKMAAQYAPKRAALKARADDMSVAPEERFAARMKLAKKLGITLPATKKGRPRKQHNTPCRTHGSI